MSITGPKAALALCLLALVFLVACDEDDQLTTSGVFQDFDVVLSRGACVCTRNGGDFIPDYCSNRADITFADLGINHESVKPAKAKSYANPTALCKDASFNNHIISQTRVTDIARSGAKAYCKDQVLYIPNCGDAIHPNCESSANAEEQPLTKKRVKDCAHPGVTFTEQAAEQASSEPASSTSTSTSTNDIPESNPLTDLEQDQATEQASSEPASCAPDEIFDSISGECISSLGMIDGGPVDDSGGSVPSCGDGIQEDPEQCDDGNLDNGDGCSATCTVEVIEEPEEEPEPATCPDGEIFDSISGGCISDGSGL